jgi:dihydroneopterin triphosphate diphosphatase
VSDPRPHKIPESVLVVIHTAALEVLLIERADRPGFWQSVTGSQDPGETLRQTAAREVVEETGIAATPDDLVDWQVTNVYEIFAVWRHRYAPGVTHNTEHVFSLCVAPGTPVRLAPGEHVAYRWLAPAQAAAEVFSWSNRQAILMLPDKASREAIRP